MMLKIKLDDIVHCFGNTFETIRDKYNRIDDEGVNHGRAIYYDREDDVYYKLFHKVVLTSPMYFMVHRKSAYEPSIRLIK